MKIIKTGLPGVLVIEPDIFKDHRGCFFEAYNKERYEAAGFEETFVQDNVSYSTKGVLRGLHFQNPKAQGKLVSVLMGEVFDVAVDIRIGSPTFGKWEGRILSGINKMQLYIPPGFAHGFLVSSDEALLTYKCTQPYSKHTEGAIAWNDPDIGIQWHIKDPVLTDKDKNAPTLKTIETGKLPVFEP